MSVINSRRARNLAIITIDYPPVNTVSIGGGVVDGLSAALEELLADASVSRIVVQGAGRCFSAGADIQDFDTAPDRIADLPRLFATIEVATKPIVMALHGMALGGGLELALAGHYRVAAPGTSFGFPEVKLGLLPGGGGTQRLTRLVGVSKALDLLISGKSIDAEEALALGLIDHIAEGDAALAWAEERPTDNLPRIGDRVVPADPAAIDLWKTEIVRRPSLSKARAHIIDCVDAATTADMRQGLAVEATRFAELLASDASQGLRHAFFSERRVSHVPGLAKDLPAPDIASVAVVGAGTMGSGITIALINAGLPVTLVEPRAEALVAAVARIAATLDREVEKGRLSGTAASERKALLNPAASLEAVGHADLVIEAAFEDLAVKREVFEALDSLAKPAAILASNTSTLDIDAIAGFTKRPSRVVGLHFFSPANIMRLLEVIRGKQTAPEILAAALAFARRIGKVGVVAGNCDGFIGNRIFEEYLRQAYLLLEEGALPHEVDRALEAWGMAMGPLRTMDLAGQDIGWSIRKRRAISQPGRPYSKLPDLVCELGRFGQKTKAGFYRYPDGRTAEIDPEINALVIRHSAELGIDRKSISSDEIVERCILAMVNEGARIVAEGVAYRALDIDVIYLNGYGFPPERGGPMFYADTLGLSHVLDRIGAYASGRDGWAWEPAPLLVDLVARKTSLGSLNG